MKIRRGDLIKIMKGKDRGKTGKILQVFLKEGMVVVEGHNIRVKHLKARGNQKGQRVEYPAPLSVANVALICSSCNKPTRVGYARQDDGKKQRQCKKCKVSF